METNKRDAAQNAAPQTDWQNAETRNAQTDEETRRQMHAADPDEEEDEKEDEDDEDTKGDWGHVDPLEGNSPFPDPMDPAVPGSAV